MDRIAAPAFAIANKRLLDWSDIPTPRGNTSERSFAFGTSTPWNRMRCSLGLGLGTGTGA